MLQLGTEPGEPEIYLMSPNSGKAGDSIVLVGKRFKAGFKIRFFADTEQGPWEAWASVNRDISNQVRLSFVPRWRLTFPCVFFLNSFIQKRPVDTLQHFLFVCLG